MSGILPKTKCLRNLPSPVFNLWENPEDSKFSRSRFLRSTTWWTTRLNPTNHIIKSLNKLIWLFYFFRLHPGNIIYNICFCWGEISRASGQHLGQGSVWEGFLFGTESGVKAASSFCAKESALCWLWSIGTDGSQWDRVGKKMTIARRSLLLSSVLWNEI